MPFDSSFDEDDARGHSGACGSPFTDRRRGRRRPTLHSFRVPGTTTGRRAAVVPSYPDDWFVPAPTGDGYPDDWIVLPPAPGTPQPAPDSPPNSASAAPSNRPAPPPDPLAAFWSHIPASWLTAVAWHPPIFPSTNPSSRASIPATKWVTPPPPFPNFTGQFPSSAPLNSPPIEFPNGLLGGISRMSAASAPASRLGILGLLPSDLSGSPPSFPGALAQLSSTPPSPIDNPSAPFLSGPWIGPAPGVFPDLPGSSSVRPNSLRQFAQPAPAPRAVPYIDASTGLLGGIAGLSDQSPTLTGGELARFSSTAASSIDNPSVPFLRDPRVGSAPGIFPDLLGPARGTEPTSRSGSELPPAGSGAPSRPMPGLLGALGQGFLSGTDQLHQTLQSFSAAPPVAAVDQSPAAQLIQLADLTSPWSQIAPKVAFRFAQSYPTLAGGVAGGVAGGGIGLAGGPVGSTIGAIGGGAAGAGLASALQTLGPAFAAELQKSPNDPEGAWKRALTQAEISGAFSGASWAAFPIRFFQGPVKQLLFQAFGVQPAFSVAQRATENVVGGRPIGEGLGEAYGDGVVGTLTPALGHAGVNRILPRRGSSSGRGVWDLPATKRGRALEPLFGHNLHPNFPTIDIWEASTGRVTSLKSIDLEAPSYRVDGESDNALYNKQVC